MTVTTRIATADDATCAALCAFLGTAVPKDWRSFAASDAAQCRRALSSDQALAVIAEQAGTIIGLAFGWVLPSLIERGDAVMLDELVVAPAHRGAGVGTGLARAFAQAAQQRATPPLHIWATTDATHAPAATPFLRAGARRGALYRQFDWMPSETLT